MEIRHPNITPEESRMIEKLLELRKKKETRNVIKNLYYAGKNNVKNLGISLPNSLSRMSNVHLGWGAKAVDALAVRSRFDGFVYTGMTDDPLKDVLRANNFRDLYRQATISELINSCAFVTIGGGMDGEPDVVFNFYAAIQAAATWNAREKRIEAGLVITKWKDDKVTSYSEPEAFILYTDTAVIECEQAIMGWNVRRIDHGYGRPLMEALVYNPTLTKPFGTSRISRSAMSIIDRAMRCAVRMDIASEFFTAPQKYLLGADPDVLDGKSKWDTFIDTIFTITKDENGDIPTYGQLPQGQITPLVEQMRALAAEFSGDRNIPISSLGIIHDNPASAEGIYATKEDLIMEAENLNTTNGNALKNIGLLALMILGGYSSIEDMPDTWKSIMPSFLSPARPSVVSMSDAIIKQVGAIPWIAETDEALKQLGYTESQIAQMKSQRVGASASSTFLELAGQITDGQNTDVQ